ncbi:MAG: nucleoside-diphosphate kinase [Bacteroidales bacterium]|nr:nucleoside-diphosphate kinase [Bacteroidales bacterium]
MPGTITLTIIKPGAVANEHIGPILHIISDAGFHIQAMKLTMLHRKMAAEFYGVHHERPFYEDLIAFMTSGPVVVAMLEKPNAVADYRKLMGATDPSKADEGTIRKLFAKSIQANAVHGSDSDDNAIIESDFFFSRSERYPKEPRMIY